MSTATASIVHHAAPVAEALEGLRARGAVRLDDAEATAIAAAVDGVAARSIELFGSRTDPAARGGDVDILILTDAPRSDTAQGVRTRFFARCEERIDVVVLDPDRLTGVEEAFLGSLRRVRIA